MAKQSRPFVVLLLKKTLPANPSVFFYISIPPTKIWLTTMLEDGEKDRKKIQAEEIKTRTILLSLNDGLIVLNKNDQVVLLNPNAEIILRIKEKDVLNKNINQIQNCPRLKRLLKKLKEFKNDKNKEFVTQYPQTRYYQIISNNAIIKNEKVNKIITIHDITREKEIDRIKSEFISIAAHQLRTPLSAIKSGNKRNTFKGLSQQRKSNQLNKRHAKCLPH